MRPVTRNPNPPYNIPATIQIKRQSTRTLLAKQNISPSSGKATYNMAVLLKFLEDATYFNGGEAGWGKLNKDQAMLVNQLVSIFTSSGTVGYGNARGALLANFGQLCDYCEMPVQDSSLAVEHILPKAQFPGYMLTYQNFFLACPVCNSVKGSKPTYTTCKNWAIKQQGISVPNYVQVQGGGFNSITWPTGDDAMTSFSLDLYQANNNIIPRTNSLNIDNTYAGTVNNEVWANINGAPSKIVVKSKFASNGAGVDKLRRDNLLNLVNLNNTVAGEFADRRVTNRTIAWLQAIAASKKLNLAFANDPTNDKSFYKLILQQVTETVQSAGYFTTWAFIFYNFSPPLNNQWSYYTFLRINATNPAEASYYIPGTNAAGLPTT
ncbi:MAG TPA: HNH endonuclease [Mucilaginibacter sp.]|nr:HNH endonuclease [Mucilaginibacter sp.]